MLSIHTNLSSLITQNSMKTSTSKLNQAIERMSSGYKVNHAKDNAANYSISTNMSTKIGAYEVAESNTMMGLDMVMTASDTLAQMQDKGERLRALATQAKNGTYGAQSLSAINAESRALISEIQRLYSSAEYNGVKLFDENPEKPVAKAEYNGFIENPYTYTAEEVAAMKKMDEFTSGASGEFKISSADDLAQLATLTNGGADTSNATFVLENDIDLTEWQNEHGGSWVAIGTKTNAFKGSFDGNGHVIKNLKIQGSNDWQGLFGYIDTVHEMKNTGMLDAEVQGQKYVGAFVAWSENGSSVVKNSYATGKIDGKYYTGTLVGETSGDMINCYASGDVKATSYAGVLVGKTYGLIKDSYAKGSIEASSWSVGGLVGVQQGTQFHPTSIIENCYAEVNVKGISGGCIGGLVGLAFNSAEIINCYAKGNVEVVSDSVGGLVGYAGFTSSKKLLIENSHSYSTVNGTDRVGGLIGALENSDNLESFEGATIKNCTTTDTVHENIGIFVDYNENPLTSDLTPMRELITILEEVPQMGLQVGINAGKSSRIGFDTKFGFDITQLIYGIENGSSLGIIDDFISLMSDKATELGATQNRLESALDESSTQYENLVSSRSTIRDADMAELSSTYVQQQILQDASATLMATSQNLRAESLLGLIQSINR